MQGLLIEAMEKAILPDPVIRLGIRKLCRERLKSLRGPTLEIEQDRANRYIAELMNSPIAVHTQAANDQHYELPPDFFIRALGKNRKYSSAFWPEGCKSLDEAEDIALSITMDRAQIRDGMTILELGCGWGSLTLAMAKRYPRSKIVALSNSAPQREWIMGTAQKLGYKNVTVLTRNIAEVEKIDDEGTKFDRVVSVEMFEHLRNYQALFQRISSWLKDDGKLFVHIFTHKDYSYPFETEGEDNWMGKYFFTGGQMPAHHLFARFQQHLKLDQQWSWDGIHYAKTAEAWLDNLDRHKGEVKKIFDATYGPENSARWVQRWRVFFMSCAELFRYRDGKEWGVSHYLFSKAGRE